MANRNGSGGEEVEEVEEEEVVEVVEQEQQELEQVLEQEQVLELHPYQVLEQVLVVLQVDSHTMHFFGNQLTRKR